MTGKIFLEQNINLTNFDQFGFGKSQFFYDPNFFNETINCQGFFSPNNRNFFKDFHPPLPNPNLQLLEWALSGLLVATFVGLGLVINTLCILFTWDPFSTNLIPPWHLANLFSRCKARVGNSTLVQGWHPGKIFLEFGVFIGIKWDCCVWYPVLFYAIKRCSSAFCSILC